MKRMFAFFLLFGIIAYIALPTIKRDVKGYKNWLSNENQWVTVQNAIKDQLVPGLQQLIQQLPLPLQNSQINHVLQQLAGNSQPFTSPVSSDSTQAVDQLVQVLAGDPSVNKKTLETFDSIVQQLSVPTLQNAISKPFQSPVKVILYATPSSYRRALIDAGVDTQNVHLMIQETGGIAFGNTIYIPVYQTQNNAEAVNILTHELTHVAINQLGIENQLPTWLNEGLAWQEGLTAEKKVDSVRVQMEQTEVERSIKMAYRRQQLLPLSADEQDILQANYNVEYEDYMAVTYLERAFGSQKFNQFLNQLHKSKLESLFQTNPDQPYNQTYQTFQSIYGESFATFEKQFMQSLAT